MLKLLLDEHIPPAVAMGLATLNSGIEVDALRSWRDGRSLGEPDERILSEAAKAGLTLVTYDLDMIPRLLRELARGGQSHGGVIFIAQRQIRSSDVGGLGRALAGLFKEAGNWDWTNRVVFLRRRA
jgi:predicted nuclease of predicted toxin-antitoxin system